MSVPPQRYFLQRIGGDKLEISVLVKPGHSPETYEPTPQQMAALAAAQLYVRIGMPFEDAWMARIAASNPRLLIVDARDGLPSKDPTANRDRRSGADAQDIGHRRGKDPHVWLSPPLAERMAGYLLSTLSSLRPEHRTQFETNYRHLLADLRKLDHDIRAQLTDIDNRRFMVYHPAWGYFADAYGLEQIAIEIDGKEPGPRTLSRLIETAKRRGIKVVFAEAGTSHRHATTIANAIGAQVVIVDPLSEDYVNNLVEFARTIAAESRP